MPNTPLTKQDLLQRLKEHEELHKQRRLDILNRVKALEARKKYIGELKSWLGRRKLSVGDLLAMYRDLQPKRADRPVKSLKPLQPGEKVPTGVDAFVSELQRQRMTDFVTTDAKAVLTKIGFAPTSIHHFLSAAERAGLVRKSGPHKNGYRYALTGRENKPKADTVARKGDPEFRAAIKKARLDKKMDAEAVGKKVGVSGASVINWEAGRYIPKEDARQKILKVLELPEHLGAEATKAMMSTMGHSKSNGAAAQ